MNRRSSKDSEESHPLKGVPPLVSQQRRYSILTTTDAKNVATKWLATVGLAGLGSFGLPEVDDRYHVWRVPLLSQNGQRIGEVVLSAKTGQVNLNKSTRPEVLSKRASAAKPKLTDAKMHRHPVASVKLRNTIILGDSTDALSTLPAESVDLVFTSPPYFNARPDYTDFINYEDYLLSMRKVIQQCHRLLSEGRFFVINVAPVLLRRSKRSEASKRVAVPFDLHRIFIEEDFEFIDDIIWLKPEGAGWATGRGRRFAADRNPLQYKAVPVTEYLLVYRKCTDRLIDWNIRSHRDAAAVKASKILDGYERTNVWRLPPASSKHHPAIFPVQLAERVIRYYSFVGDTILDPFAGIGTVGEAAIKLGRRFVLVDSDPNYVDVIRRRAAGWLGRESARAVFCIGCPPLDAEGLLL